MKSIKEQIAQGFKQAFEEAMDNSYKDMKANIDDFYSQPGNPTSQATPPPGYDRTGQLAESLTFDEFSVSDSSGHAQLSLDTSYKYNPSGRDTQTIYTYAETGGLLGKGGFWGKSMNDIENNIIQSFGKRFK